MTEQEQVRKQMEDQLKKVNFRLEMLDMIDDKLLKMKRLTQRVVDEDLTENEIKEINKPLQGLVEQVKLLDSEATELLGYSGFQRFIQHSEGTSKEDYLKLEDEIFNEMSIDEIYDNVDRGILVL